MIIDHGWKEFSTNEAYRCPVYLISEERGDFSVIAANLPGVASQGDTEEEALENIKEALAAAISVYMESGTAIPWLATPREPDPRAKTRWVIVHV
jgi:predicted RNase H-like HicB family nuclease